MEKFKNLFLALVVIFLFELTFAKIANTAACTATNGVYSKSEIQTGIGCGILPEYYEVTIYKIYFCRSELTSTKIYLINSHLIIFWKYSTSYSSLNFRFRINTICCSTCSSISYFSKC